MSELEQSKDFNSDNSKVVSNCIGGTMIDRIYGGGHLPIRLVQKDGSEYKGLITKKSIRATGASSGQTFKSHVYVTEDGRWFDRAGMPIEEPKKEIQDDEEN